jgi:hypothetical protein
VSSPASERLAGGDDRTGQDALTGVGSSVAHLAQARGLQPIARGRALPGDNASLSAIARWMDSGVEPRECPRVAGHGRSDRDWPRETCARRCRLGT